MENISLNRVELRGRVGQDPKVLAIGESKLARFSVATSEIYKDRNGELKEETTWHNVAAWQGRGIENFDNIRRGAMVSVVGRIRVTKYTTSEGDERVYTEVLANRLNLVENQQP